ncbi:MAG: GNAT family N-acetyltransferase [Acidobacteria bacterium]|nr:GNAT family N-acetyltransferase [Acidobacteriota bacterium]
MTALERNYGKYFVTTDRARLDLDVIHEFLRHSYWAEGIPREIVVRSIENSLCFGVFTDVQQVGFARVITDSATYAYLADVFILAEHRGGGVAKFLLRCIFEHPQLQGLRRWTLVTRDGHSLYSQFGFHSLAHPERFMEIVDGDIYRRPKPAV